MHGIGLYVCRGSLGCNHYRVDRMPSWISATQLGRGTKNIATVASPHEFTWLSLAHLTFRGVGTMQIEYLVLYMYEC